MNTDQEDNERKALEIYFSCTQNIFHANIVTNLLYLNRQTLVTVLEVQEKKFYENPNDMQAEFEYDFTMKLLQLKDLQDSFLNKKK